MRGLQWHRSLRYGRARGVSLGFTIWAMLAEARCAPLQVCPAEACWTSVQAFFKALGGGSKNASSTVVDEAGSGGARTCGA